MGISGQSSIGEATFGKMTRSLSSPFVLSWFFTCLSIEQENTLLGDFLGGKNHLKDMGGWGEGRDSSPPNLQSGRTNVGEKELKSCLGQVLIIKYGYFCYERNYSVKTSKPGNAKEGSITVPLTSCLNGLESAV